MRFKLLGVNFTITYMFSLSLTLFIALDKSRIILPLIVSVLIHELSHLIVLTIFKSKPKEIILSLGTINIKNNATLSLKEEIIVLLAGPLANFFVFLLCYALDLNENFANINLILFVTNMFCIEGLDGGIIIACLIKKFFSTNIAKKIIFLIKILNILLFSLVFFLGFIKNYINVTLIFFIIYILLKKGE